VQACRRRYRSPEKGWLVTRGRNPINICELLRIVPEKSAVVANMRARAEQCRRLANALTDRRAATILLNMAEEIEADIARLESGTPSPPPASGS
jgi:hypothetical protein